MGFHSDGELILQDLAVKSLTDLQGLLPSAEAVEQAEDRLRPVFFLQICSMASAWKDEQTILNLENDLTSTTTEAESTSIQDDFLLQLLHVLYFFRPGGTKDSCSIRQFGGTGGIKTFMNLPIASILHQYYTQCKTWHFDMSTLSSLLHVAASLAFSA